MSDKFYMVSRKHGANAPHLCATEAEAITEAMRFSKINGGEYYVYEAIGSAIKADTPIKYTEIPTTTRREARQSDNEIYPNG
ncbi:MAG: hypothetical protein JKY88_17680 [Pseudomonadales bacterium]|nr:hypothetical protein [Pseudomonadales bacterium]